MSAKLDKARWWILRENPFYGGLTLQLQDKVGHCPSGTACTDGRQILWEKAFLDSLSDEETRAIELHETLHCAHGHFWRLNPKDPLAQMAADYEINGILAKMVGVKLPKGALFDVRFEGLAAEQILAELRRRQKPSPEPDKAGQGQAQQGQGQPHPGQGEGQGEGQGQGQDGKGIPDPGRCGSFQAPKEAPDDKGQVKAKWQEAVIVAAQAAGLQKGDLPGDLQRLAEAGCQLAVPDWRAETADWLRSAVSSTRNDWNRSRRRMSGQPVIYARQRPNDLATVVAVRDTSGSVSSETMGAFNELIGQLIGETSCRVLLLDCDAEVNAEYEIGPGEEVPVEGIGGKGTSFAAAMARVAELIEAGEPIAGVVYCTDMECGGDWGEEPNCPVLWVATTKRQGPWGRTVQV